MAQVRDAGRSRLSILDAAERLFAERGFEASSLADIASAAGLSRATPSYFFGNKAKLYAAVLERVFEEREAATEAAFQPLVAWSHGDSQGTLGDAMTDAVSGYIDFLRDRPAFVRLIQQEELSGGSRLRTVPRRSQAMSEAFHELRSHRRKLELRDFRVDDAVLVFISLTFSPLAQRATFMAALERDLDNPQRRRAHVRLVVSQLLHLITGQQKEKP